MSALPVDVLHGRDAARLAELETVIERGLSTFVEVGAALAEVRESRLYRDTHATFEAYCRERWGWSDSRSRQLIAASEVARIVTTVTVPGPRNEAVARELVAVMRQDPAALPAVMAEATERAGVQPVTAAIVREVVRDRFRSMAAESETELQAATAHWTDDQRAAVSPERMRQRGELFRLTTDIGHLPDPRLYAREHRDLGDAVIRKAEEAHAWLTDFLNEWRHL